jgi:hypothetical protein
MVMSKTSVVNNGVRFFFVSGENAVSEIGYTVVDAWGKIVEAAKTEPMPAWLRTDKVEAWTQTGTFLNAQTWDERTAELDAVNLSDSQCDCEMCDGTGFIVFGNKIVTDRGTKWQRTATEQLKETCPACDGACRVMSEAGSFNGPG